MIMSGTYKHIFLFLLIVLFSCDVTHNIKPDEVDSFYIKPEAGSDINYGTSFKGKIYVNLMSGKTLEITRSKKIEFQGDVNGTKGSFAVTKRFPDNFNDTVLESNLHLTTRKGEVIRPLSLQLNYMGGMHYRNQGNSGYNGSKGEDAKNKTLSWGVERDGHYGSTGYDGGPGEDGSNMTVYVWKEDSIYYLYAQYAQEFPVWRYFTLATKNVSIELIGGNGGAGGAGGDGGKGRDGRETRNEKVKSPGAGGAGGNGGNGGNGGKGGNLILVIHPSATDFESRFQHSVGGGIGGSGGIGGKGGSPGDTLSGQTPGAMGPNGANGNNGSIGVAGTFEMKKMHFDFKQFK